MREQWWDEEHLDDDFSRVRRSHGSQEAFNWFHRKDGKLVGLWKWSMAALSSDEGKTWSSRSRCRRSRWPAPKSPAGERAMAAMP